MCKFHPCCVFPLNTPVIYFLFVVMKEACRVNNLRPVLSCEQLRVEQLTKRLTAPFTFRRGIKAACAPHLHSSAVSLGSSAQKMHLTLSVVTFPLFLSQLFLSGSYRIILASTVKLLLKWLVRLILKVPQWGSFYKACCRSNINCSAGTELQQSMCVSVCVHLSSWYLYKWIF